MTKLTTTQIVVILLAIFVGLNIGRYFHIESRTQRQQYGNAIERSVNNK